MKCVGKTSARADKPVPKGHKSLANDATAVEIGAAYKTLIELKKTQAKAIEDVELREVEIGGMLIDVRLTHKRKFGKWLDANAEVLGFKRAHAYNLINCVKNQMPWQPDSAGWLCLFANKTYETVEPDDFRTKAANRAQKWRDKNKAKLARLEAYEAAERAARDAKKRDKAKAEREALGPSRFDKETILGDGTVVPTLEPEAGPKTPNWHAKAEALRMWLRNCPRQRVRARIC